MYSGRRFSFLFRFLFISDQIRKHRATQRCGRVYPEQLFERSSLVSPQHPRINALSECALHPSTEVFSLQITRVLYLDSANNLHNLRASGTTQETCGCDLKTEEEKQAFKLQNTDLGHTTEPVRLFAEDEDEPKSLEADHQQSKVTSHILLIRPIVVQEIQYNTIGCHV